MITQPVTFVIGAGASKELGLPLGTELRDNIANDLREFWNAFGSRDDLDQAFRALVQMGGSIQPYEPQTPKVGSNFGPLFTKAQALATYLSPLASKPNFSTNDLQSASAQLVDRISAFASIDDFLAVFSKEKDVVVASLTKAMINWHIRKASQAALENDALTNLKWILVFWRIVSSGAKDLAELEASFQKVKVVNFNYDLTFEFGIRRLIADRFTDSEEAASRAAKAMNVIHPYGNLFGGSDDTWDACLKSTSGIQQEESQRAGQYIRTIHEGAFNVTEETIKNYFEEARKIVFLGFGFHSSNLDWMNFDKRKIKNLHLSEILFSHFGLSNFNAEQAKKKLRASLFRLSRDGSRHWSEISIEARPETASDFLENISFGLN